LEKVSYLIYAVFTLQMYNLLLLPIYLYTGKNKAEAKIDASRTALFEIHKVPKFEGEYVPKTMAPKSTSDRLKETTFNSRGEAQYFLKSLESDIASSESHSLAAECKAVPFREIREALAHLIYSIYNKFCFCSKVSK